MLVGVSLVGTSAKWLFSNRKWSKHGSIIATEVMMFTRKMKSVQIYCSPSINNVDSRIRQIVEILVDVRKIGNKGFSLRFMDYQTGEFLNKTFLPMSKAKRYFGLNLYMIHTQWCKGFLYHQQNVNLISFFEKLEEIHDRSRGKKPVVLDKKDFD